MERTVTVKAMGYYVSANTGRRGGQRLPPKTVQGKFGWSPDRELASLSIEERVRWLLAGGLHPRAIAVVSFTRAY